MLTPKFPSSGFTLAELLIALAILGVIATFTIPKVLQSQSDNKYKSMTKEAASLVAEAYSAYKLRNTVTGSTSSQAVSPYLNYVKLQTAGTGILQDNWGGSIDCDSARPCYVLHNGGYLQLYTSPFTSLSNLDASEVFFDPDGPGATKGVWLFLYYSGRITSVSNCYPGTLVWNASAGCPQTGGDPSWFNWN